MIITSTGRSLSLPRRREFLIVALNLRSEIITKCRRGNRCPFRRRQEGDPSGHGHVRLQLIRQVTGGVRIPSAGATFDNFYQSQILWDETMAHSAADFLKEKPGYQLVVLAGEEHIMYDSGIPQRLKRLTGSGICYAHQRCLR